jgi:alkylation response protein AidB-like acyl-CoA dehydrogenase
VQIEPTDEQDFLRSAVRGVVEREAPFAQIRRWAFSDGPGEAEAIAVRQGWSGIGIAEERGGQGGGTIELAILAEELGRGAVPADRLYAGLLAALLLDAVDGPDASALVERLAEGEPATVLGHEATSAVDRPLASDGPLALVLAGAGVPAVLTSVAGELRLVPASARERAHIDRTRSFAEVTLDAEGEALGSLPSDALTRAAARAAVLVAADALGAMQRLLDLTVEYVADRRQFGVPVGSFQAVGHLCAQMLVDVEATRSAVLYAGWALDAGEQDAHRQAWMAKAQAAVAAPRTADRALFLHGAIGYTWEHDLQLLFKRAKSDAWLFGSASAYQDRVADELALA